MRSKSGLRLPTGSFLTNVRWMNSTVTVGVGTMGHLFCVKFPSNPPLWTNVLKVCQLLSIMCYTWTHPEAKEKWTLTCSTVVYQNEQRKQKKLLRNDCALQYGRTMNNQRWCFCFHAGADEEYIYMNKVVVAAKDNGDKGVSFKGFQMCSLCICMHFHDLCCLSRCFWTSEVMFFQLYV